MTLGGAPLRDGGHSSKNLTLDKKTIEVLTEVRLKNGNESQFAERAIRELADRLSFSCMP